MRNDYKQNLCQYDVRCVRCGTLLAKKNENNYMIKYKQLIVSIEAAKKIAIICRTCGLINEFMRED
jgi:phage FluMu protein Com